MSRPKRLITTKSVVQCGLVGLIASSATACSGLADGRDTYCETVGAGVGGCASTTDTAAKQGPWWCLGQPPETLPDPTMQKVALVLPVVEWNTRQPLMDNGLTATLCPGVDAGCPKPIAGPIPITSGLLGSAVMLPPGAAGIPVFDGFDGFIKFGVSLPPDATDDQQFVNDYYFLGGIISGPLSLGPPILMFQKSLRSTIVQQSFPNVNAATVISQGAIAIGVYDCNANPVNDARVELTVAGQPSPNVIPFVLPASRIPLAQQQGEPLYTKVSGGAGFLNVPVTTVEVSAYQRDNTRIGSVELVTVAGELTIGTVRPDYSRKADIRSSALTNSDGMTGMTGTMGN